MDYKIIAYISGGNTPKTLDLSKVTHVNFAFGWVKENEIELKDPSYLSYLREETKKAGVKLLVSLQQRGSTWFCKRSKKEEGRKLLAQQAKDLLDEYDLDGIDVDWEYPGINIATGEHDCDTCIVDFVELLKEMRALLGDKLLTYATPCVPDLWAHTNFEEADKYLDYINVMGYDYNWSTLGESHQSNLFPGEDGKGDQAQCGDRAIKMLLAKGLAPEKLNLGVPFYGYRAKMGANGFLYYDAIAALIESGECEACFDEKAGQSYLKKDGEFFCCYDSPRTMAIKAQYVKDMKLGGMMYWTYNLDGEKGVLRDAVYNSLK